MLESRNFVGIKVYKESCKIGHLVLGPTAKLPEIENLSKILTKTIWKLVAANFVFLCTLQCLKLENCSFFTQIWL